jgi:hypothetical protein
MNQKLLSEVASALKQSGELDRYIGHSDPIEHEVAYDICEIVESMKAVLETNWPEIINSTDPKKVGAALFETREQLRHILYHIENSAYFSIICTPRSSAELGAGAPNPQGSD